MFIARERLKRLTMKMTSNQVQMVRAEEDGNVGWRDANTFSESSVMRPSDWNSIAERTESKYSEFRL